jgi:hypothetical protein
MPLDPIDEEAESAPQPPCCASSHVPRDTACRGFLAGLNGRCVYCDHEEKCHPGPGATCEIGSGESAPQPTPETRVDVEVLLRDALELFDAIVANTESIETEPLTHRQGVWVTTIQCHAKVGAAEIRGVAPSLIAELRARRAAPTGQQQEVGAAAIGFVRTFARALLGDEDGGVRDWMRESGDGTLLEEWHAALTRLDAVRPAAPPSAPQEGLRPREIAFQKKARERAVLAHKPVKTDTRPRCTAKTRRGFPCPQGQHTDGLCMTHAAGMWHRYVKQRAVPREWLFMDGWEAGREAAARAILAPWDDLGDRPPSPPMALYRAVDRVRALPLPESALLTKAAPLTQPAVPEKDERTDAYADADAEIAALKDAKEGVAPVDCCGYLICQGSHAPVRWSFCAKPKPCPDHPAMTTPVETRLTEEEKK